MEKKEIREIDEDAVTESGEPVPKPDWVKVTSTIIEKKYRVSKITIHFCLMSVVMCVFPFKVLKSIAIAVNTI